MTREDKCKLAIEKGYTYDEVTGKIYGVRGKEITRIKDGYIRTSVFIDGKYHNLYGHQLAYYIKYGKVVDCIDHIDGDRSNNRIVNLREVTKQQNLFNNHIAKGYSFNKRANKYKSQIYLNRKNIYLGLFNTEEEARNSYLDAKEKYHLI
jgi:hypothetical protein